ncbi:MAG TPA: helix-turn-helix transcriptional regulator [Sphingobium sp.]|nr:helix-turn-helix transcriptional regulator [Sphingobium sp.]
MSQATYVIRETLELPTGKALIADRAFHEPVSNLFVPENALWIDMCLTPRPHDTQLRYANRWPAYRFERVGQVLVMPAGELLQFRSGEGRQTSIVCQIQLDRLDYLSELQFDWTDRRLEACFDLSNPRLSTMLRYLAEEIRRSSLARDAMADLMMGQIAIELARHLRSIEDPATIGGLGGWRLKLIDERLAAPGPAPSLPELAQLCALSVRQLTRAFRISRGCSVSEYISEMRLERAKRLLTGGDSVKSIAFALGFQSASIFSYTFRRKVGMTPRQFRAQALTSSAAS